MGHSTSRVYNLRRLIVALPGVECARFVPAQGKDIDFKVRLVDARPGRGDVIGTWDIHGFSMLGLDAQTNEALLAVKAHFGLR